MEFASDIRKGKWKKEMAKEWEIKCQMPFDAQKGETDK